MSLRLLLPMTVLTVLTAAVFSPNPRAEDGVARTSRAPYYFVTLAPQRPAPNPTYWTWMPCPLHGGCYTCWDANCPGGKGVWTLPAVRWVLDPNYYAVAPDYGWSPPGKAAVQRNYVTYTQYHPENWYGSGSAGNAKQHRGYQVIGQPTDTAQMGYYYQQVPTWQPRPGMIPGTPDPRNWHWRPDQVSADGTRTQWVRLRDVWVPLDQIPGQATPQPEAVPVPEPMPPEAAPVPAPPGNEPRATNEQADGTGIRRAGLNQ